MPNVFDCMQQSRTSNWNKKTPRRFCNLKTHGRRFQVASHALTDTLSNHYLFRKGPHPTAAVRAGGSSIPARALQVDLLLHVERIIYGTDANIEEMRQRLHMHITRITPPHDYLMRLANNMIPALGAISLYACIRLCNGTQLYQRRADVLPNVYVCVVMNEYV